MRITACFDTFEEAEACAQALRRNGEGIRAIRIRRRNPASPPEQPPVGEPPEMTVPFVLYNGQTGAGQPENGVPGGTYAGVFAMDFALDDDFDRNPDGPAGRQECLLDVLALPSAAAGAEQTIVNSHGRKIRRNQL